MQFPKAGATPAEAEAKNVSVAYWKLHQGFGFDPIYTDPAKLE